MFHEKITGWTPLMYLSMEEDKNEQTIETAKELVNTVDIDGTSVLMMASQNNSSKIVQLLIDHGANVNQQCPINKVTALMSACQNCDEDKYYQTILTLVNAGADVNSKKFDDITALMALVAHISNPKSVQLLIDNGADLAVQLC